MNPPVPQRTYTIPRKPLSPTAGNGESSRQSNGLTTTLTQDPRAVKRPDELARKPISVHYSTRRLTKPPRVYTARKRTSRTRLQKRVKSKTKGKGKVKTPSTRSNLSSVFVLKYEDYPYNTRPGTILGVYSSHDTVTTGAIRHGAYAFSREGMRDGSEYLSPTGRIKIIETPIQRHGISASLPKSVPASIPHPAGPSAVRSTPRASTDGEDSILLALHQSPTGLWCVGAFADKKKAWGACWKHRGSMGFVGQLREGTRWLDEDGMPHTKSRLVGTGWHEWYVVPYKIDGAPEPLFEQTVILNNPGPQRRFERVNTPDLRSLAASIDYVSSSSLHSDFRQRARQSSLPITNLPPLIETKQRTSARYA
jgi:hypothetical protein